VLSTEFEMDPWEIEKVRNRILSAELVLRLSNGTYSETKVGLDSLKDLSVPAGWLCASLAELCRQGYVKQDPNENFMTAKALWKPEIEKIHAGLDRLVSSFREIEESRSSNFASMVRDYMTCLGRSDELADALRMFGQKSVPDRMKRRNTGERIHLTKHHPGPWICSMAREYSEFLQESVETLPSDFGGARDSL
jgi:hypothetical protein